MRFLRAAAATLATATAFVAASSDVVDLTGASFESEVMGEKLALVEFFAPWVGRGVVGVQKERREADRGWSVTASRSVDTARSRRLFPSLVSRWASDSRYLLLNHSLAPHYEEAATELKSNHNIKLAKVDCTENQELCSEHGIKGYPYVPPQAFVAGGRAS